MLTGRSSIMPVTVQSKRLLTFNVLPRAFPSGKYFSLILLVSTVLNDDPLLFPPLPVPGDPPGAFHVQEVAGPLAVAMRCIPLRPIALMHRC